VACWHYSAQVHPDLLVLEPASTERWVWDMDRYADALGALKKDEAQFCSFIRCSFSEKEHILQHLLLVRPLYSLSGTSFLLQQLQRCPKYYGVAILQPLVRLTQSLRTRLTNDLEWVPKDQSLLWKWSEIDQGPTPFVRFDALPDQEIRHQLDEFVGPVMKNALWKLIDLPVGEEWPLVTH